MFDAERLHGIIPPILTPLTDDEEVDYESLRNLVNYQLDAGVHGIWAAGTTGEFPCFDHAERENIVRTVVQTVRGRVPVVANVGDAGTRLAIDNAHAAKRAGADFIALTPPYYYSNSQDELIEHFRALHRAVDLPLLVYNIPQTVKVKMDVASVVTLAVEGTVVGIKDSQNDLDWFRQLMTGLAERGVPFRGFLGTRYLIDSGILAGAHGAIPGLANLAPRENVQAYEAVRRGDWAEANRLTARLMKIQNVTSLAKGSANASAFSGMKAGLKALGVIRSAKVRMPLRTVTAEEQAKITAAVADLKLPAMATVPMRS